ncbi:TDP-N-acetylfucosamine:lipid II N-acetylfucosaminyltransferase [Bizionia sp.]|uniref:TDP-N-acetylfucosamine:lipid II N-acetylfucosaminyltransferase n=1 Tax=Bizionia sp. TaxID=1954480 RepID=UPI003A8E59D8
MLDKRYLHVFNDDKFIDPAIDLFEANKPNNSRYFILTKNGDKFKYVTSALAEQVIISNDNDLFLFIEKINSLPSKYVFLHALDNLKINIVNQLNEDLIKVWFIWGYDLYGNWEILQNKIYTKATKQAYKKQSLKKRVRDKIVFNDLSFSLFLKLEQVNFKMPKFISNILNNNFNTPYYRALQKIDVVAPVLPKEYELVKKLGVKIDYAPFTYGCIEDLLGNNIKANVFEAPNILLGNSADPTNNHIDIIKQLAKINLGSRKVYVPLSYGGNGSYINHVIQIGEKCLGKNFIPLKTFMPLETYNEILLSCGTLIFNHIRQQGIGNIISAGYLGAKIFLNKKSPAYSYYKSIGLHVYNVSQINNKNINVLLTSTQIQLNRDLLLSIYSFQAVQEKIDILFEIVESKNG